MIELWCIRFAEWLEPKDPTGSPAQPFPSRVEPIMCDDFKPLGPANRAASQGSSLGEIARALGVPVSSFFASGPDEAAQTQDSPPGAAALLELVQAYLLRATPAARSHFVARVQAMAEPRSG